MCLLVGQVNFYVPLLTQLLIYAQKKWRTVGSALKKKLDEAQVVVEQATAAAAEDETNEELKEARHEQAPAE